MALDLSQVIRIKGSVDGTLAVAPEGASAAYGLTDAYIRTREICLQLVKGTEAEAEFAILFPDIFRVERNDIRTDPGGTGAEGERARALLGQLSGWLGSWPSAEDLLAQLIAALETAEATAEEPAEKARIRGILDGLRGVAHDVAIDLFSAYLERSVGMR